MKAKRSILRQRLEHTLLRAMARGIELRPAFSSRLGRGAARIYLRLAKKRRHILLANLRAAFPEKSSREIARIARRSVEDFGEALIDFLIVSRLPREELPSRVSVVGKENLLSARARGNGVLLLSAHFGSWEIGALVAGLLGEPIASVVRPLDNPLLEEELTRRRTRFGNRVIRKKEAAREILKAMRKNETVAILIDQNVLEREAVFVPFFGRPAATTPSLARLQSKSAATVVPVFTWPEGEGRYRLEFEPPIFAEELFPLPSHEEEGIERATARYMQVTEAAIRKYPAAWLWIHNRWRTQPLSRPSPDSREASAPVHSLSRRRIEG